MAITAASSWSREGIDRLEREVTRPSIERAQLTAAAPRRREGGAVVRRAGGEAGQGVQVAVFPEYCLVPYEGGTVQRVTAAEVTASEESLRAVCRDGLLRRLPARVVDGSPSRFVAPGVVRDQGRDEVRPES
jgi:hypothetical protein